MRRHWSIISLSVVCLVISSCDDVTGTSSDLDLIKLYLEEFRLELLSVKSQLVRMARNSKLLRVSLKELRSSKCGHNKQALGLYTVCVSSAEYSTSLIQVEVTGLGTKCVWTRIADFV